MNEAECFASEAQRHADDAIRYADKAVSYAKIARALALTSLVAALVAIVLLLTACGGSSPAPAASPSPSPTFTALTLHDACRVLRDDILANGGTPDRATLRRIIGHSTDGHLITAAKAVRRDLGKSDGLAMGFDLSLLHYDCSSTGVQIPTGIGSV
ncbi:MAG TPA: hypothetical protein VNH17_14930 [Streptosporangiaceae bacterium]|nr:hypothetical protein [Streptosporangiaceae bacterium]